MAKRKYISEFGINMYCDNNVILQQESLSEVANYFDGKLPDFHIYMICKRPRFIIKPNNVNIQDDFINIELLIQIKETFKQINLQVQNDFQGKKAKHFIANFPYNISTFLDSENNQLLSVKNSILATLVSSENIAEANLEILYVGQAFGVNGERTAIDRLSSHSTLQKIYSEALNLYPDSEIWLMLCSFSPAMITAFDGRTQDYQMSDEEDDKHINNILSNPISMQQKINFTEAALIKYFKPQFNDKFKNQFPSSKHKSYSECYEIDLNSIFVEVGSDNLNCMIYSNSVLPKWTHYIKYALHSKEDRKSMLDLAL